MTDKTESDKKKYVEFILKLEGFFLIMSIIVGISGYFAYDLWIALKLFLGIFLVTQLVLVYIFKDILILTKSRDRNT